MDPDQTRDVAETFDDWARRDRGEGMEAGHRPTAEPVLDRIPIEPDDRFLDLGAGIGWAARDAAGRGARAIGVDASAQMLSRARRHPGPAIALVQAGFEQLPFPDRTFQLVFSMEALYYASDLDGALAEVHRVLAPGGELHALIDYYEENEASRGWPEKTGLEMHRLSEQAWLGRLSDQGFTDATASRARASDEDAETWKIEEGSLYLRARRP